MIAEINICSSRNRLYVLALLIFSIFFFLPSIVTGKIPSGFDSVHNLSPWKEVTDHKVQNSLLLDDGRQFLPWKRFTARTVRNGEIPFWNPHNGTGAPFVGNLQSAVFYPLNSLYYLFPGPVTNMLILIIKLFLAGVGTFLFLRLYGLDPGPSFISGISFGFCGFMTLFLYSPITNVALCLPFLFLGILLLKKQVTISRMSFLGFMICVQFLGGHIETSYYLALACGLFTFYLILTEFEYTEKRCKFCGFIFGAVLLGVGLAMIQLGPFLEYLQRSRALAIRDAEWGGILQDIWGVRLVHLFRFLCSLPMLVFPGMYGDPVGGIENYVGAFFGIKNYTEMNGGFIGIVSVCLAFLSITRIPSRSRVRFFWVLFLLGILGGFNEPIISSFLHQIPGLSLIHHSRMHLFAAWGGSVLAGFQLQYLKTNYEWIRKPLLWLISIACVFLVTGAGLFLTFYNRIHNWVLARMRRLYESDLGGSGHAHPWSYWRQKLPDYLDLAYHVFIQELLIFIVMLAVFLVVITYFWQTTRRYHYLAIGLLALLVFGDISRVSMGYYTAMERDHIFPELPVMNVLEDNGAEGRVLGLKRSLIPNTNLYYGFDDIRNFDAMNVNRPSEVLSSVANWKWFLNPELFNLNIQNRSLFDFFNIQYVVSPNRIQEEGFEKVHNKHLYVYENQRVSSRFHIATDWKILKNDQAVLDFIRKGTDLRRSTLLTEHPFSTRNKRVFADSSSEQRLQIHSRSPNKITFQVQVDRPAILTGSVSYDPGWEAQIDGQHQEVLQTNYAFLGVPVEPGTHEVLLRYRPNYWTIYLVMAAVSGSFMLVACLAHLFF